VRFWFWGRLVLWRYQQRETQMNVPWEKPATTKRVQIPAWSDHWMQGDRYGDVEGYCPVLGGRFKTRVRLDKSRRAVVFYDCELTYV